MAANCKARGPLLVAATAFGGAICTIGSASGREPIRIGSFPSVAGPAAFFRGPEQKR